ncbi:uncharacterized protein LOC128041064 [Gossypium raimondii]|uniref:uncharacterized protein LOC128041064 n=1 Tax=Gossypium raimondii TaxID=29730 RepID=UPI00227A161C|nr:uncharacterized protein LOC128041064 [Gossypium raimondii]
MEAPVLIQPKSGKEFTVYSDTSHVGLGCVLMQEIKVVAHASPQLKTHERRWIELLKGYDCTIEYHPGKANVVANALSRRAMTDLRVIFARLSLFDDGSLLAELQVEKGNTEDFGLNSKGVPHFHGRICVRKDTKLKQSILREVQVAPMLCILVEVKAEHQLPSGLLQPIKISLWKWERVTMDFISGLPLTPTKKDFLWVIMDRLTKSAHFIPVRTDYSLQKLAKLYMSEIVRLHGLELPPELDRIHDVFHVSILRRYRSDLMHIVPVEEIEVKLDLTFEEEPVQILE